VTREIESVTDLTEEDVAVARRFSDLCDALAEYAGDRAEYKLQSFDEEQMAVLAENADAVYQQLAVIVAQQDYGDGE